MEILRDGSRSSHTWDVVHMKGEPGIGTSVNMVIIATATNVVRSSVNIVKIQRSLRRVTASTSREELDRGR